MAYQTFYWKNVKNVYVFEYFAKKTFKSCKFLNDIANKRYNIVRSWTFNQKNIINRDNPVRRYFKTHAEGENGNLQSICKIQNWNKKLVGNHLGNLKRHLKVFHKVEYQQILLEAADEFSTDTTNSVSMSSTSSNSPDLFSPTQKRCRENRKRLNKTSAVIDGCIEMVTVNGRPLRIMEDSSFRKIVGPIFRSFGFTMNADVVRDHICNRASLLLKAITDQLKNKFFCIKMDTATRLGRTIHGKIIIRNLATAEIYEITSNNLKCVILKILEKYSLSPEFIYSITTDNGANMLKTVSLLREMNRDFEYNEEISENEHGFEGDQVHIDEENNNNIINEQENDNNPETLPLIINDLGAAVKTSEVLRGMRFAAHTLQLSILDVFKMKKVKSIINKSRSLVKTLRLQKHLEALKNMNLKRPVIDCVTRWGSTYDMLESLLRCQQFCQVFINHQMTLNVDSDFWTTINDLKIALGPAKITSCLLQTEQLYSEDCLLEWKKCIINTRKINNYYKIINSIYCIKSNGRVNALLDEITIREAKNYLILLSSELLNDNNIDPVIIEQLSILSNHIEDNEVDDLELELRTAGADRSSGLVSRQEHIKSEIVSFMQLPREDKSKNIIDIWTKLKKKYPLMYECAMVALALPTTQVTMERLFSSLKCILNDQRNRMNPSLLEDIMVL
ncbi:hypothetical protein QTP88_026003 [Uroleucon formosanum]